MPLFNIIFFLEHTITPEKSERQVKDYVDYSCGDDSDKDFHWKPKTNSMSNKSKLNYLLYLNILKIYFRILFIIKHMLYYF